MLTATVSTETSSRNCSGMQLELRQLWLRRCHLVLKQAQHLYENPDGLLSDGFELLSAVQPAASAGFSLILR